MFELLKDGATPQVGGPSLPNFQRARAGLQRSVERIRLYRQSNPSAVPNVHPLALLLHSLNVPITLDPIPYLDKVGDVSYTVAKSLRMSTALASGQFFNGVFFGAGCAEQIWAHTDPFDSALLQSSWRDLQPIRVLSHPHTDLSLRVPDGRGESTESGTAVVAVNVPMLASQWRMWRHERQELFPTVSQRSVMQFLMEVPLPNMLYSQLDVSVFNRLSALSMGKPVAPTRPSHSYALTDWAGDVDQALLTTLLHLEGKSYSFDQMLSVLPQVYADDYRQRMRLPDLAYVRQLQPSVLVARMGTVAFLTQLNYLTDNQANRDYLTYLRRYLTQYQQALVTSFTFAGPRMDVGAYLQREIWPYL